MITPRAVPVQEGVHKGVQEGNRQSKTQGLHGSKTINSIRATPMTNRCHIRQNHFLGQAEYLADIFSSTLGR